MTLVLLDLLQVHLKDKQLLFQLVLSCLNLSTNEHFSRNDLSYR